MEEFEDFGDLVSWKEARFDGIITYGEERNMGDILEKYCKKLEKENERLNNIINELEKEIDRLLERQYESERFAKEQGFDTYLPAKENLLCVKNKLQELKDSDKE